MGEDAHGRRRVHLLQPRRQRPGLRAVDGSDRAEARGRSSRVRGQINHMSMEGDIMRAMTKGIIIGALAMLAAPATAAASPLTVALREAEPMGPIEGRAK